MQGVTPVWALYVVTFPKSKFKVRTTLIQPLTSTVGGSLGLNAPIGNFYPRWISGPSTATQSWSTLDASRRGGAWFLSSIVVRVSWVPEGAPLLPLVRVAAVPR